MSRDGCRTPDAKEMKSFGFCLLNNVAIGAAYAKYSYKDIISRVAIVDIDVHHGNGTEAVVRNLVPTRESFEVPGLHSALPLWSYKPWQGSGVDA
jgi:hypothetical protein